MSDSNVPINNDYRPRNNLLPSLPRRPRVHWKVSFVYKVELSNSVSTCEYGIETLTKIEDVSLEIVRFWSQSIEHLNKPPELEEIRRSYREKIFEKLLRQVRKLVLWGRIDGWIAETEVVVETEIVRELGTLRLLEETEEDEKCAVCLQSLSVGISYSLPCWHIFHRSCIKQYWLHGKKECPVCRLHFPDKCSCFFAQFKPY